jgi:hypothetical protein
MTTTDNAAGAPTGPLSNSELSEYHRLTAMVEDVEQRRMAIASLRHGLRRNPARLALLDEREQQLYAEGTALMSIRAPLYLRFKWPKTQRER